MYVCFKMVLLQHNKYILTFVWKKVAKSFVYKKDKNTIKLVSRLKYYTYISIPKGPSLNDVRSFWKILDPPSPPCQMKSDLADPP